RLNATIDAAACETMTGAFRFGRPGYKRSFSATRAQVSTSCTRGGDTFALIEQRVLAFRGCTVTSCHGVFGQASLDLVPGSSYESLVGVPASNPAAAAAGKLRVLPGHAAESFLSQKLHGTLADGEWAFCLNPGTHRFAIFPWDKDGAPTVGVWQAGDVGCISGAMFGNTLSGSPQAPYFIDLYAPGIARILRAGTYIGLNAHYANNFDVPIQMKVWTNIYPYPGTPEHIARTITDFNDMFTISVPPFTQKVQPGRFTNEGTTSIYVL